MIQVKIHSACWERLKVEPEAWQRFNRHRALRCTVRASTRRIKNPDQDLIECVRWAIKHEARQLVRLGAPKELVAIFRRDCEGGLPHQVDLVEIALRSTVKSDAPRKRNPRAKALPPVASAGSAGLPKQV